MGRITSEVNLRKALLISLSLTMVCWPYSLYLPFSDLRLTVFFAMLTVFLWGILIILQPQRLKRIQVKAMLPIGIFLGLNILSWVKAPFMANASILRLLVCVLIAGIAITAIDIEKEFKWMLIAIIGGMMALNGILVVMHINWFHQIHLTPTFSKANYFMDGFVEKNRLSLALGLFLPFTYTASVYIKKWWAMAVFALFAIFLVLTFSRLGVLMLLLTIILPIWMLKQHKKYILSALILIGIVCLAMAITQKTPRDFLNTKKAITEYATQEVSSPKWVPSKQGSRIRYIKKAWQGALQKPLFGHGINSFRYQNPDYYDNGQIKRYPGTHNDYAEIFYGMGIIGVLSLAAIYIVLFRLMFSMRSQMTWVSDGQIIATLNLMVAMLVMNLYMWLPFWFMVAGTYILGNSALSSSRG